MHKEDPSALCTLILHCVSRPLSFSVTTSKILACSSPSIEVNSQCSGSSERGPSRELFEGICIAVLLPLVSIDTIPAAARSKAHAKGESSCLSVHSRTYVSRRTVVLTHRRSTIGCDATLLTVYCATIGHNDLVRMYTPKSRRKMDTTTPD